MTVAAGVRVEGLNKVLRDLQKWGADADELRDAFEAVGRKVASDAQVLAPARSGNLRGTIRAARYKAKSVIKAGKRRPLHYATFVEYGTRRQSPQNFVTKAVKKNQGFAVSRIEHELKQLSQKYNLN